MTAASAPWPMGCPAGADTGPGRPGRPAEAAAPGTRAVVAASTAIPAMITSRPVA